MALELGGNEVQTAGLHADKRPQDMGKQKDEVLQPFPPTV